MPSNGEAANGDEGKGKRVHPAFAYAFRTVGFLLTDQNLDTFSDDDVSAWNEAVAEGERRYGPIN